MPVSYDTVLVIDLEATTVADDRTTDSRDIIEIGACLLHPTSGKVEFENSVLVRPSVAKVTPYCTALTGITAERARTGRPFVEACDWLRAQYGSEKLLWASYGAFDYSQLATQCLREGVEFPLHAEHVDIKVLASLLLRWRKGKGLDKAMTALSLKYEGQRHSAQADAVAGAKLLARLLGNAPKAA